MIVDRDETCSRRASPLIAAALLGAGLLGAQSNALAAPSGAGSPEAGHEVSGHEVHGHEVSNGAGKHWAVIEKYCFECHNTSDWAGGLAFDTMSMQDTPHANLLLTLLQRAQVLIETLGNSTGVFAEV